MPINTQEVLVLRCTEMERVREFFQALMPEVTFQVEKHGNGPEHFSVQVGSKVLEIYPPRSSELSEPYMIGKFLP